MIEEAKTTRRKRILIVVVSTTIIEIGRDFCFDYAVVEPRSHWSLVQVAGRVMRHRVAKGNVNISILSHSLRATRSNTGPFYTFPGPEIRGEDEFCLSDGDRLLSAEKLFEFESLGEKIDSSITMLSQPGSGEASPIKKIENRHLESLTQGNNPVGSFLDNPLHYLTTYCIDKFPFRTTRSQDSYVQDKSDGHWGKYMQEGRFSREIDEIGVDLQRNRVLFTKNIEEIESEYEQRGIRLPRMIDVYRGGDRENRKYHPLLGML